MINILSEMYIIGFIGFSVMYGFIITGPGKQVWLMNLERLASKANTSPRKLGAIILICYTLAWPVAAAILLNEARKK